MSTRVIKFKVQTQAQPISVETDARTLGELKEVEAVKNIGINWSEVSLVEKRTKTTLELDSALLPASDTIIFVSPIKTKAGADYPYAVAKAMVKQMIEDGIVDKFNYTHSTTSELNKIIEENQEFLEEEPQVETNCKCESGVTIAVKGVDPEDVKVVAFEDTMFEREDIIADEDIVELVTTDDLEDELDEITAELNG